MFTKLFIAAVSLSLIVTTSRPAAAMSPTLLTFICDSGKKNAEKIVEHLFARGLLMPLSSYDDDPFVQDANVECMDVEEFARKEGLPILVNDQTEILDEAFIYREDQGTGEFKPFAWNPWPEGRVNMDGSFRFPNEERFPEFKAERGPDGKIILRDGLQVWTPNNLQRGMTTTFEAVDRVKNAAEEWSGREIAWGQGSRLQINAHSFIDFNAFYAPGARQLFFGVAPYRLAGETTVRMFETVSSWELVAHEASHALHHALKPNSDVSDVGWRTWSESFADQLAMWTSLRDPGRVRTLLAETSGDLNASNALSRTVEAFDALTGAGPLRDAVHDKKISDTSEEVHDRSEVFTGAAYRLFLTVYNKLSPRGGDRERALSKAGTILGTFVTRALDYMPENAVTLESVAKAYLKVDEEFYGGRYHEMLVEEFLRREIFDADSLSEWLAHEATVPDLRLLSRRTEQEVEQLVQVHLDTLGIGPEFGLTLQSVTRDDRLRQTIVRVQLTLGRGESATPLDNHGILVFRANGTLADYHAPLPPAAPTPIPVRTLITHAVQRGLDQHGAPLSLTRTPEGQLTAEARVLRGKGMNAWVEAFTESNPAGERREVLSPEVLYGTKAALLERAGTVLTAEELTR